MLSQRYNALAVSPAEVRSEQDRRRVSVLTLLRVGIPSLLAGFGAYVIFPALALSMASSMHDPGVFSVLSQDSSQFVQNFLTVAGLLFSILVGQTCEYEYLVFICVLKKTLRYKRSDRIPLTRLLHTQCFVSTLHTTDYFLYTQQESIYYALFQEVTEAKSLLEQVALVCQGRSMYPRCLESISKYVQNDLKQIQSDPAVLLSARPVDDPLESIMYMTSVGVPSTVYETVKSLREARAKRLGALQRKLPSIHFLLLWILAAIELVSFPLLGAGTQTLGGYNLLSVEGCLFGVMTGGIVMTLRVVGELWRPAGGAYNVDSVLSVMVMGLEEELKARMAGRQVGNTRSPSGAREALPSSFARMEPIQEDEPAKLKIQQQGADPVVASLRIYRWVRRRFAKQ